MDRRSLERRLEAVTGFADPAIDLEQYPTDPAVAAHLCHRAALSGDLAGRTVVDLGSGTGVLALGAALAGADRVVGVERDRAAIATARENERAVDPPVAVEWLRADVRSLPVCLADATVLSNPPFGAQNGRSGADRPFLDAAAAIAGVSYTIHNAGSRAFVESYAGERGGTVAAGYSVVLDVDRQFPFHQRETGTVSAEAYCIRWNGPAADA